MATKLHPDQITIDIISQIKKADRLAFVGEVNTDPDNEKYTATGTIETPEGRAELKLGHYGDEIIYIINCRGMDYRQTTTQPEEVIEATESHIHGWAAE